jgi:hypothetical protein
MSPQAANRWAEFTTYELELLYRLLELDSGDTARKLQGELEEALKRRRFTSRIFP